MWDLDHNNIPKSLDNLFIRRKEIHNRTLRDNNKNKIYTALRYHNRYGYDSFQRYGGLLLNEIKDLPFYDKSSSKVCFLKKYKNVLLESY